MLWKEHWISLKWCQYLSLLMFLTLVIKRSLYFFLFPDCLRLISGNFHKNFIKVFLVLGFFLPSELKRMYRNSFFRANFLSSFFDSCLMLKVLKLQIISDKNVNKKISHKNYVKLSQDNTSWKSSSRKLDLSCGIEMYHFEGLL